MRKTNIALLVAVVVSSPIALAEGYDYDYDYDYSYGQSDSYGHSDSYDKDKNITVTDSFNDVDVYKTDVDVDKTYTSTDIYKSDDDKLILHDVKNDKSRIYTDNSTTDYSQTWTIDVDTKYFVADSYLDGSVTYSDVTYGACCNGGHYGAPADPSTLTVTHSNMMAESFGGASGINIAGQNAGNNSLVQQSASTNAILSSQ